jgi:RNA polymerase sigma-70 factor (ECF subfamily)
VTDPESTLDLLERARSGDRQAMDLLFARYVPLLRRWATGRLPRWARDLADTHDLVQETLLQTFRKIRHVRVSRRRGAAGVFAPGVGESDPGGVSEDGSPA